MDFSNLDNLFTEETEAELIKKREERLKEDETEVEVDEEECENCKI